MNRTEIETNDKISKIAESVVDRQIASEINPEGVSNRFKEILNLSSDNVNELREVKEKISSNEVELSSIKYELQLLETVFKKNGLEMKQDLDELKQELKEIKDEIRLMCEAITDVLPNKLIEAFQNSNDRYSFMSSDLEVVDFQNKDLELTE
jgi:predicted  nucleic acid-binding Zn-ribbon protein